MKVLVIGSEGFIGSATVTQFQREHRVVTADILGSSRSKEHSVIGSSHDLIPLFNLHKPDLCINASGSANVSYSISHPGKDKELNTDNVWFMLDAIRKSGKNTRFVNFSSAAVYGNPVKLPIKEEDPTDPLSPYGIHKLESERILRDFHEQYGIPTVSLRVFSAYGPGLKKQLFWDIWQKAKKQKEIVLSGNGEESRDFIFVADLMKALELVAANSPMMGECINVASGTETRISEAAEIFLDKLGGGFRLSFNGEVRQGDPRNWRADIGRLERTGFRCMVTMENGLDQYAAWVSRNA